MSIQRSFHAFNPCAPEPWGLLGLWLPWVEPAVYRLFGHPEHRGRSRAERWLWGAFCLLWSAAHFHERRDAAALLPLIAGALRLEAERILRRRRWQICQRSRQKRGAA